MQFNETQKGWKRFELKDRKQKSYTEKKRKQVVSPVRKRMKGRGMHTGKCAAKLGEIRRQVRPRRERSIRKTLSWVEVRKTQSRRGKKMIRKRRFRKRWKHEAMETESKLLAHYEDACSSDAILSFAITMFWEQTKGLNLRGEVANSAP